MKQVKDCICGNHNYHTRECKGKRRRDNHNIKQKKIRHEKRAKGLCIVPGCKCKGETKVVIHQYCKDHKEKIRGKK